MGSRFGGSRPHAVVRAVVLVALIGTVVLSLLPRAGQAPAGASEPFSDGFENGTSSWTVVEGVVAQGDDVRTGQWSARAQSTGAPTFARRQLAGVSTDLEYSLATKAVSYSSSVTLMGVRSAANTDLVSLYLTKRGKLALRNAVTGRSTVSSIAVPKLTWHTVSLTVRISDATSHVEVSLNGSAVRALSGSQSLGTAGVGWLHLGDSAKGRSFHALFDDVAVRHLAPDDDADTTAPSVPTGLAAKAVSPSQVDLSWTAATDDVAVTGYDLYRDSTLIAALGSTTAYSDAQVQSAHTYTYEVRARDGAGNVSTLSSPATVTTPDAPVDIDPVIAAAGDIACSPTSSAYNGGEGLPDACRHKATSDLLLGGQLARVLPLGDIQYEKGELVAFLQSYDPTWGRLKQITSPVPGNHEYAIPDAADYFQYFGAAAADPTKGYYSYDIGAWHLIALNSNCAKLPAGSGAHGCAEGSPQNDWLEADLAANPATCTLAYWHHPRFSSGQHGNTASVGGFWTDLYASGADVVLSGHDHSYERFTPLSPSGLPDSARGIRQFVVGTGGKNHYPFPAEPPATSEVREHATFGVLKLTLHPSSYDWSFVPEPGQPFVDSGTNDCH